MAVPVLFEGVWYSLSGWLVVPQKLSSFTWSFNSRRGGKVKAYFIARSLASELRRGGNDVDTETPASHGLEAPPGYVSVTFRSLVTLLTKESYDTYNRSMYIHTVRVAGPCRYSGVTVGAWL